jgi:predicted permease
MIRSWLVRFWAMFWKKRLERDLDEDIQEHLDLATDDYLRQGLSPQEAEIAARRSFGRAEPMKEELRDQRGIPFFETLSREMRIAIRSLRRAPDFTVLAILTLALAIGANSAIFSAVNRLLFNPTGVDESRGLVAIRAQYQKLNLKNMVVALNDFEDVRQSKEIFSAAAIARTEGFTYTGGGAVPQRVAVLRVSAAWFDVLRARAAHGRTFTSEEDVPDSRVVVLSDAIWRRMFGSDISIVGNTMEFDKVPYRVIGIMRPEDRMTLNELGGLNGQPHEIFMPMGARLDNPRTRYTERYLAIARLQPGVDFETARTHMTVLTNRGYDVPFVGTPRKDNAWGLTIVPFNDFAAGDMKTPILILWGAVGLVLLIACSNIAGLTMARTAARRRELTVRAALGGNRRHFVGQILMESSLLGLAGSVLGLFVAYAFIRGVELWAPENVAGGLKIPFDLSIVLFTAAAGMISGALFGLTAAAKLRTSNVSEALKAETRNASAGSGRTRLRSVLVTAEITLAFVLSACAGLFLRSLSHLEQVDTGFRADGVMSASVVLRDARYQEAHSQLAFYRSVLQAMSALPGVRSAAAAYPIPFGVGSEGRAFRVAGRAVGQNEPAMQSGLRFITPDFFETLRIPLQRGRIFTEQDIAGAEPVAVIDARLAQQYWPNEDPIGQQVILSASLRSRIVGIVGSTRNSDLASSEERGIIYFPMYQQPISLATFIVLTAGAPETLAGAMQAAVNSVDSAQALYDAKTMEERVSTTLAGRRFTLALLSMFAFTAVSLAALGLFGVISYGVTERTREIGIRMALGAQRSQVLSLVLGKGLRINLIGLVVGWIAAFQIARLLPDQLFGVRAFDPVTFAGMAVLLTAVAVLASYVPARRAVNLDPVKACRYE